MKTIQELICAGHTHDQATAILTTDHLVRPARAVTLASINRKNHDAFKEVINWTCPSCGYKGNVVGRNCFNCGKPQPKGLDAKYTTCPKCDGSGDVLKDGKYVTCSTCNGSGDILTEDAGGAVPPNMEKCPKCKGFGRVYGVECDVCHGEGFILEGSADAGAVVVGEEEAQERKHHQPLVNDAEFTTQIESRVQEWMREHKSDWPTPEALATTAERMFQIRPGVYTKELIQLAKSIKTGDRVHNITDLNRAHQRVWQSTGDVQQNTWSYYQCKECRREFQTSGGIPDELKEHQEDTGHKGISGPYK
jgi:hypothetical protein